MAFSGEGAAAGAATGAAAGPWGAVIGGVIGGFSGGGKSKGATMPSKTQNLKQVTFGGLAVGSGRNTVDTRADQRAEIDGMGSRAIDGPSTSLKLPDGAAIGLTVAAAIFVAWFALKESK